jgi:hypothetical protein
MRVTGYWLGCNIWASTELILSTKSIKQGCANFFVLPTILSVKLVTTPALSCCNSGLIQNVSYVHTKQDIFHHVYKNKFLESRHFMGCIILQTSLKY